MTPQQRRMLDLFSFMHSNTISARCNRLHWIICFESVGLFGVHTLLCFVFVYKNKQQVPKMSVHHGKVLSWVPEFPRISTNSYKMLSKFRRIRHELRQLEKKKKTDKLPETCRHFSHTDNYHSQWLQMKQLKSKLFIWF